MQAAPDVPTAFEEQVQKLGLNEQNCVASEELRQLVRAQQGPLLYPRVAAEAVADIR